MTGIALERVHVIANGRRSFLLEPLLLGGNNFLGKRLERLVIQALRRIVHDLLFDLLGHSPHHHLRLHHPLFDPGAHQLNRLVHIRRKFSQPDDPVLIVLHGFENQRIGQLVFGLNAAAMIERHQMPVERVGFDSLRNFFAKQLIVQPFG